MCICSTSPATIARVFFFSSRRRHTRLQGDWSSDVCSSDLPRCRPDACGWKEEVGYSWQCLNFLKGWHYSSKAAGTAHATGAAQSEGHQARAAPQRGCRPPPRSEKGEGAKRLDRKSVV